MLISLSDLLKSFTIDIFMTTFSLEVNFSAKRTAPYSPCPKIDCSMYSFSCKSAREGSKFENMIEL